MASRVADESGGIRLVTFLEDEGLLGKLRSTGVLTGLLHRQGTKLRVRGSVVEERRRGSCVTVRVGGEEFEGVMYGGDGFSIRRIRGDGSSEISLRLTEVSRTGSAPEIVGSVSGDVALTISRIGLVPVGVLAPNRHHIIRALPTVSAVSGAAAAFPLGSSSLIIDDARMIVRLSAPIDLSGTVYRIGATGLLATFESLFMTSRDGRTDVRVTGGRLWQTRP